MLVRYVGDPDHCSSYLRSDGGVHRLFPDGLHWEGENRDLLDRRGDRRGHFTIHVLIPDSRGLSRIDRAHQHQSVEDPDPILLNDDPLDLSG